MTQIHAHTQTRKHTQIHTHTHTHTHTQTHTKDESTYTLRKGKSKYRRELKQIKFPKTLGKDLSGMCECLYTF